MNRLIRLVCALLLAAIASLPTPAAAQACSMEVEPVLEFGTILEVPTPATVVTARIFVDCGLDTRRVCVGISAGTGLGSTVADRRMSILGLSLDTVGYALFQDAALTRPFGNIGDDRAALVFIAGDPRPFQTITIYGRLTPGQTGKPVGEYLSTLLVNAESFNVNRPNCTGSGFLEDSALFVAHLRIRPTCTIVAAPLHFGAVSELTGTSGTTNLSVTCSNGSPYRIGLDGGLSPQVSARLMRRPNGIGTIFYDLYRDAAHTQVWGDTSSSSVGGTGTGMAQSIPVYGFVPAQREPQPGSYRDTITATVTY